MKSILSVDTTVKLSGLKDFSLFLLKVLAFYWMNLERVSADAHTPRRFSIFINSADPPWLSIVSVSSVCIGIQNTDRLYKT